MSVHVCVPVCLWECVCVCVSVWVCECVSEWVSLVSDGHRHLCSWLRFRVQLLPHLRRQQLKLLCSDLWLVGGGWKPNTPPTVCQYAEGQWKICSWMQHASPYLATTKELTWCCCVMLHASRSSIRLALWSVPPDTLYKQEAGSLNDFVQICWTHFTLMPWCLCN